MNYLPRRDARTSGGASENDREGDDIAIKPRGGWAVEEIGSFTPPKSNLGANVDDEEEDVAEEEDVVF